MSADPDRPHRYLRRTVTWTQARLTDRRGSGDVTGIPPCDTCGGSELARQHLLAPAPRRKPATVARALADYNAAAESGNRRAMLAALDY